MHSWILFFFCFFFFRKCPFITFSGAFFWLFENMHYLLLPATKVAWLGPAAWECGRWSRPSFFKGQLWLWQGYRRHPVGRSLVEIVAWEVGDVCPPSSTLSPPGRTGQPSVRGLNGSPFLRCSSDSVQLRATPAPEADLSKSLEKTLWQENLPSDISGCFLDSVSVNCLESVSVPDVLLDDIIHQTTWWNVRQNFSFFQW